MLRFLFPTLFLLGISSHLMWILSTDHSYRALKPSGCSSSVERLLEKDALVLSSSLSNGQEPAAEDIPRDYHWTGQDIEKDWVREVDRENVILRSPRLSFENIEQIDSIVLTLARHSGVKQLTVLWNDKPALSSIESLRNRKELWIDPTQSRTVTVEAQSIADVQFLGTRADEKALRFLFLRFAHQQNAEIPLESVGIIGKDGGLLDGPGRKQDLFQGELRDTLFFPTPGQVSYRTRLDKAGDLSFGIRNLKPDASVRYRITVERLRREMTVFDRVIKTDQWLDFRVPLPLPENGHDADSEATIKFESQSGKLRQTALWSNPMLVTPNRSALRPNVIVYVMDALRPDHLGIYGYAKRTSPFIDKLGNRGIVFTKAYAPSSWTKPSVTTLLTSLHPQTHGVGVRNYTDSLPTAVWTLQDYLRRCGYVTASFSANPFSSTLSNLTQGFDYAFTPNAFQISDWELKKNKIHSDDLNAKIFPWLEKHSDDNFFLYVQSMDTHRPFSAPALSWHTPVRGGEADSYDAEIRFNDEQVRKLYEKLVELGIAENTLFVVTSDHGHAFGEHGQSGHGLSLYEEEVRVPLIMAHRNLPNRVFRQPVQLADVMPTILGFCGIPFDAAALQGLDLIGALGRRVEPRAVYLTRFTYPAQEELDLAVREMYAVIRGGWKLIVREHKTGRSQLELYNLNLDRFERQDLAKANKAMVAELLSVLREFHYVQRELRLNFVRDNMGGNPLARLPIGVSKETIDQLRSLGYIR